jgi:CDP-diacylglycerol---serine O-phosphatidyltransferase
MIVKKIAILPTMLTLGNAVSGFAAITYASKIDRAADQVEINYLLLASGCLILLAMVFDALDGYVARLSKSDSQFGGQLDSLSDVISFGVAPAFLLLTLGKLDWGEQDLTRQFFRVVAALYLVCAVLRLARFNLENVVEQPIARRFKGLPSPGAAGCLAGLVIVRSQLGGLITDRVIDPQLVGAMLRAWTPVGGLVVALLMVSRFSYPHLTKNLLRGRHDFALLVEIILVLAVMFLSPVLTVFLLFWVYALQTPVRSLLIWGGRRGKKIPTSEATHRLS